MIPNDFNNLNNAYNICICKIRFTIKILAIQILKKQQKSNNKKPEKICENGHH